MRPHLQHYSFHAEGAAVYRGKHSTNVTAPDASITDTVNLVRHVKHVTEKNFSGALPVFKNVVRHGEVWDQTSSDRRWASRVEPEVCVRIASRHQADERGAGWPELLLFG